MLAYLSTYGLFSLEISQYRQTLFKANKGVNFANKVKYRANIKQCQDEPKNGVFLKTKYEGHVNEIQK